MRVKLQTLPPLKPLKAWFQIPSNLSLEHSTIDVLKLCLPVIDSSDVVLVLDDFELLGDTTLSVLREGDLICIKSVSRPVGKRKAEDEDCDGGELHTSKKIKGTPRHGSKLIKRKRDVSVSSTSSGSNSSSSSGSSLSGSSSSTSDTSSESESDSPPAQTLSKLSNAKSKSELAANHTHNHQSPQPGPPVPPGYGKSATHARNLRRRLKRMYDREKFQTQPQSSSHLSNRSDLPHPKISSASAHKVVSAELVAEKDLHMLSLISKNRNKKKRIRKSLVGALPQKIIFDTTSDAAHEPDSDSSSSDSESSSSDSEKAPLPKARQPEPEPQPPPRLITPSEGQESGTLPPGLFVTSVDVEEGIRQPKRKSKKRKTQHPQTKANGHATFQDSYKELAGKEPWQDPETFYADSPIVGQAEGLYQIYEHTWEDFPRLDSFKMEDVKVGSVVGWYSLMLDQSTFTPQNLLMLARVTLTSVTDGEGQLVIQPIPRPSESTSARNGFNLQAANNEDLEGTIESETWSWQNAVKSEWRVIQS